MDVRHLAIPFRAGPINWYLISNPAVTLVDPGIATGDAFTALGSYLERQRLTLAEIDQLLITHPHVDHFGIASRVKDASGAAVIAHTDAV